MADIGTEANGGLAYLRQEPVVWVRMAAVLRDDGRWHARLVELTTGAAPHGWTELAWRYPAVLLAASEMPGGSVEEALGLGRMAIAGCDITTPPLRGAPHWERRQSRAPNQLQALDWPAEEATVGDVDPQAEPHEPLVSADGAPSFTDFSTAAAHVFIPGHPPMGWSLPRGVLVRRLDTRARILSVRVAEERVVVTVEGDVLDGMDLELAGDAPGPVVRLEGQSGSTQTVDFPLDDGLPSGAWVLVKKGAAWIDRRFLARPLVSNRDAGVEFVEPRTRLEVFLLNREGSSVEFKRIVPTNDESKWRVMKTVCAFANGDGGSVLFGVDDDDGTAPGLAAEGLDHVKDSLTEMVGSWVDPRPELHFDELPVDSQSMVVLEMRVDAGAGLHVCRPRRGGERVVYIRHHATSVPARPAEIERIVRARQPATNLLSGLRAGL